jgi:RNA polymerase sigma-70 factor (ECF subfamily)
MARERALAICRAGRERWPGVRLSDDDFLAWYDARFADAGSVEHAADVWISCACVLGCRQAAASIRREYESAVRSTVRRVLEDPELARDVEQEVWNKILVGPQAKIGGYSGKGPLGAWVRATAAHTTIDVRRGLRVQGHRLTELDERVADRLFSPESELIRRRYRKPFQVALGRAMAQLSPKERSVLRLHVVGQASIDEIGRAYRVHRATAARWIERACAHILDAVRRDLSREHVMLTKSELLSIARALESELELTLRADRAQPPGRQLADPRES